MADTAVHLEQHVLPAVEGVGPLIFGVRASPGYKRPGRVVLSLRKPLRDGRAQLAFTPMGG
jgi:hypothetical protein